MVTRTGKQLVDAYIAAASPKARPMLRQLRRAIRSCAPEATERLSYRMPYYAYFGRLVYFAAFTNHVSMFISGRPMKVYAKELKKYQTGKATLQFPIGKKVPVELVKKMVAMRARENEARKTRVVARPLLAGHRRMRASMASRAGSRPAK